MGGAGGSETGRHRDSLGLSSEKSRAVFLLLLKIVEAMYAWQ